MDFSVEYLSFFVIHSESASEQNKRYRHFKTMDGEEYERSEIKRFLDGEFARIVKRKAEKHAPTEGSPTKIGTFVVEPGYELGSNPNYNMIARCREARDREQYHNGCDDLLRAYIGTSSVRGGAFIVARAVLPKYFDEPFLFILKCDFEPKIARITDEDSLVGQVDMAISAKSMKSIQYPHMPEEGMLEYGELKIHQASHARYFEEFLAYVSYEQSMPELVQSQVLGLVQEYMEQKYQLPPVPKAAAPVKVADERGIRLAEAVGVPMAAHAGADAGVDVDEAPFMAAGPAPDPTLTGIPFLDDASYPAPADGPGENANPAMLQEAQAYELWANSDKRRLQERWDHEMVVEAAQRIVEFQPELDLKFHIGDTFVKTKLSDFGSKVHFAKIGNRYVVLLEGEDFKFDKDFSPVELLQPEELDQVVDRLKARPEE
ncbi:MAG: hypothetical protein K0Q90_4382 [Paenibacillaceae bacterium]|jgi:hypothetical protein|nr:hypothetical protein [Paenibacillaceae bacterium]